MNKMAILSLVFILFWSGSANAVEGYLKFEHNTIIDMQIIELNIEKEMAEGLYFRGTLAGYNDGFGGKEPISFFVQSQDYDIYARYEQKTYKQK